MRYFSKQADGFVIGSEVGEFWVCSMSERKQLTEIAVREAHGKPVIVNVTALSSSAALDLAQHSARHGARACIVCPPGFAVFSAEEVFQHIRLIAHYCELPTIVCGSETMGAERMTELMNEHNRCRTASGLLEGWLATAATEEFQVDQLCVSPQYLFASKASNEIRELAREIGTSRIVKPGLEELGLECGPLRGPYRWPPKSLLDRIRSILNPS